MERSIINRYILYLSRVKKQNWVLGVVISLGLCLIVISFKMMRNGEITWGLAVHSLLYDFTFAMFCWVIHSYLLKKQQQFNFLGSRFWYRVLCIGGVAMLMFAYEKIMDVLQLGMLHMPDATGSNKRIVITVRGGMFSGLYFFIIYHLHILAEKQKHSIELEQLKQAQLAANLASLKEQLSPHFLFNTLNTLSSMTQEKEVKDYVSEVANVYRYLLTYNQMDTATLQQELAFIESYMYIIKTRLEDAIDIKIQVEEALLPSKIPPLTLQLLIENAIKHNIASASKQLKIDIYNEGGSYLVVSNNYQPKNSVQFSTGIGLDNVMKRFQLLFERDIIIEKTAGTFTVKLPISIP